MNVEDLNMDDELLEEEKEETVKESNTEMSAELKSKDEKISELNTQLLRLQADFVNFRKRSEKERENSINYGIESFACDLLPILDNFQRALNVENKDGGFYQGVKLIEQQFISVLNNYSIKEIESMGKPFDPNFHHAVVMEESTENEEGIVIEVLQKGYLLKDKVIRPSMVKVSK